MSGIDSVLNIRNKTYEFIIHEKKLKIIIKSDIIKSISRDYNLQNSWYCLIPHQYDDVSTYYGYKLNLVYTLIAKWKTVYGKGSYMSEIEFYYAQRSGLKLIFEKYKETENHVFLDKILRDCINYK